jgi:hypothetical protein
MKLLSTFLNFKTSQSELEVVKLLGIIVSDDVKQILVLLLIKCCSAILEFPALHKMFLVSDKKTITVMWSGREPSYLSVVYLGWLSSLQWMNSEGSWLWCRWQWILPSYKVSYHDIIGYYMWHKIPLLTRFTRQYCDFCMQFVTSHHQGREGRGRANSTKVAKIQALPCFGESSYFSKINNRVCTIVCLI